MSVTLRNLQTQFSMFDKVIFILAKSPFLYFEGKESVTWLGMGFTKQYQKARRNRPKQIYYEGEFRTLRIAVYEQCVCISNSLSSFIYVHNANDITYAQLCEVVNTICKKFECCPEDLRVKYLEFCLTFQIDIKVERILKRLTSHWGKRGKEEYRLGHLVSIKFHHIDYSLKVYDKAFVEKIERLVRMEGNWFRLEQQYKYTPKYVKTAKDLLLPENIGKIFAQFLKQWRLIKKAPFIDHTKYSIEQLHRIYALLNPVYSDDRQDYIKKDSVKKEQQRFRKELAIIGNFKIFETIEEKMIATFQALMSNEYVPAFPAILIAENRGQEQGNISELQRHQN